MLTIKCDKCGRESDNEYTFNRQRFAFLDKDDGLALRHLCYECQDKLESVIDNAIATFLDEALVRDWEPWKGVV